MLSELSAAEFNPFFRYESPERAFAHFNKGEAVEVVEGRETGLIVYKDDNTTGLALLPKSKNGAWKIRTLWSKTVYQKAVRATDEGCTVTILQARGTDDFYVNICDDFRTASLPFPITEARISCVTKNRVILIQRVITSMPSSKTSIITISSQ